MTLYLTSDPHLGHAKVAELRGYANAETHDLAVMHSYAETLTPNDDLWILGDISSGSSTGERHALATLAQLAEETGARLHLVAGNHDSCSPIHRNAWRRHAVFLAVFESVQSLARRRGPDRRDVLMSHYPYPAAGDGPHRPGARYQYARVPDGPAWLLHGHTHQPERLSGPRSIHVGWDAWRRPVPWHEIETLIKENA